MSGLIRSTKEREANARLIAAAPDLLEACKLVIACCVGNPGQCHINASGLEIVRVAIAKAEGK